MDPTNQNQSTIIASVPMDAATTQAVQTPTPVAPTTVDPNGVSFFNTSFNTSAVPATSAPTDVAPATPTASAPVAPIEEPAPEVQPTTPPAPSALSDAVDFNMNKPASVAPGVTTTPSGDLIPTDEAKVLPKTPGIPAKAPEAVLDFSYPTDEPETITEQPTAPVPAVTAAPSPVVESKPTETPAVTPAVPVPEPTQPAPKSETRDPVKDLAEITKSLEEINKKEEPKPKPNTYVVPKPFNKKVDSPAETQTSSTPAPKTEDQGKPLNVPPKNKPADGSYPYKIEELLDMVVQRNASDLHISQGYPAMLRIDDVLTPVSQDIVDKKAAEDLIFPLMEQDKRDILEVNREVDFGYSFGEHARFRINAYFERKNLAAALRMIPTKIKTMEDLQLPKIFSEIVKLPQGLVLVTGPTGSGKSTTLAAMIDQINKDRAVHIVTIEDPIEYIYSPQKAMIDQREMHEDTNSWDIALRSVLRQDPDVVLVGEMRDFETIAAALTVAETGHLVFATLHTNSASQSIDRIIDVFPEFQQSQVRLQLSNVVEAVIAQRLVPVIGGGRRVVTEVMLATPAVRNLIREGKTEQIDNTIRTGLDVGMSTLEQSLVKLVREGKLSLEDAQMHTTKPDEVLRLVKG